MRLSAKAVARARQLAMSAPVPDAETIARLRALLGATRLAAWARTA